MENLNSARRACFPLPLWERVDRAKREPGEGADSRERQNPLTRLAHFRSLGTLSQPKSDISDFGQSNNCRTRVNPSSAGRGEESKRRAGYCALAKLASSKPPTGPGAQSAPGNSVTLTSLRSPRSSNGSK